LSDIEQCLLRSADLPTWLACVKALEAGAIVYGYGGDSFQL